MCEYVANTTVVGDSAILFFNKTSFVRVCHSCHNVHPPDSRGRVSVGEYAVPDRLHVRVGAVALLVVYYHSALVYVCQLRCDAWAGMPIATKATAVSAFMQPPIRLWPDAYNVAKVQKYLLSFVRIGRKIVLTIGVSGVVRHSLSTDTPFFSTIPLDNRPVLLYL